MKQLTIYTTLFFVSLTAHAQMNASFRGGYSFKSSDVFGAVGLNYTRWNATLGTDLMIGNPFSNTAVNFLAKASYKYRFLEAGIETGPSVYSLDDYDDSKNSWVTGPFIAALYKLNDDYKTTFFIQYEYLKENKLSIGVRTPF